MFKKWLDTPITWRKYFKMCGICGVISTIYVVWLYIKIGFIDLDEIKIPFRKKETED